MITILAVGKKHDDWVESGIARYEPRLKKPYDIHWQLLPHSVYDEDAARVDESGAILAKLKPADYVILLDERGENISSPALSGMLEKSFTLSRNVVVIIGGAYGVDDSVHARADFVWSLSRLVFPHQLVRLVLIEQLYRAQQIAHGHPYHHS